MCILRAIIGIWRHLSNPTLRNVKHIHNLHLLDYQNLINLLYRKIGIPNLQRYKK